MNRINRKVRLNIENFEDRSVPSASPLYPDVFIPDLAAAGEPAAQTREHILLARQVGVLSATGEPEAQTREHILLARQVGVPSATSNQGWGHWEMNLAFEANMAVAENLVGR